MRRLTILLCLALAGALVLPSSASAGGSWLAPVQERYDPGDTATLVGYTGGGSLGPLNDGPFYAYLYRLQSIDSGPHPRAIPLAIGELDISLTGDQGYSAMRAAISFDLPEYLEPGTYWLHYCNEGCDRQLGDLIAGVFSVGEDPAYPVTRYWPLSEPEIAAMADDATVSGPGRERTVGELRAAGLVSTTGQQRPTGVTMAERRELNAAYLQCVAADGVDLGVGAQVLFTNDGVPYHVKTAVNVAGDIHGPCLEAIGGPVTTSSSWGPIAACSDVGPGCDLQDD